MNLFFWAQADAAPASWTNAWEKATPLGKETLVILVVLFFLSLALSGWALASRSKRRHSRHRREGESSSRSSESSKPSGASRSSEGNGSAAESGHHRRHRHRREDRPRNPTLAETGGLPPIRGDDVAPPGP